MAVPGFQDLMLPVLELEADGEVRSAAQIRAAVSTRLGMSERDLAQLLPSGKQTLFANRLAWACFYLRKTGLLDRPSYGHYRITDLGKEALAAKPKKIDQKFLSAYPGFESLKGSGGRSQATPSDDGTESSTPEEILQRTHAELNAALADELLSQIKKCDPAFFEQVVVDLLVAMGYGGSRKDAGAAVGKSGDEGIDGIIQEDRLGLDVIYIQAKRWEGTVGSPEVQKFVGALHGKHAKKGVLLTTGAFSNPAHEYAAKIDPKVILIDGQRLAELMIEFDLGVSLHETYQVKRLDSDFFEDPA